MRVIKNDKGVFIDDAPMSLTGKVAKEVLADLESGQSRNPRHEQVLAECREAVKKRKAAATR